MAKIRAERLEVEIDFGFLRTRWGLASLTFLGLGGVAAFALFQFAMTIGDDNLDAEDVIAGIRESAETVLREALSEVVGDLTPAGVTTALAEEVADRLQQVAEDAAETIPTTIEDSISAEIDRLLPAAVSNAIRGLAFRVVASIPEVEEGGSVSVTFTITDDQGIPLARATPVEILASAGTISIGDVSASSGESDQRVALMEGSDGRITITYFAPEVAQEASLTVFLPGFPALAQSFPVRIRPVSGP